MPSPMPPRSARRRTFRRAITVCSASCSDAELRAAAVPSRIPMTRRLMIGALVALTSARALPAQSPAWRAADSLLRAGMLERAESVYYAEARHRPRDPQARAGLGLFLLSRGAVKIG